MLEESRQFRTLFRAFLTRTIDLELLSPGGEFKNLVVQFAAIMAAFNFIMGWMFMRRYFGVLLPRTVHQVHAWVDEELLVSTTMAAVGLFAVLAWDNLLPDLRDRLVLGVLPVRVRTMVLAKLATIGSAIASIVLLTNLFTSLCFTGVATTDNTLSGVLRTFLAYWITMAGAALFTFCFLVSIQAIAALLLSYRLFLRVSGLVQLCTFFSIVAIYFLKPSLATPRALAAPQNWTWLQSLPSYWFLGLFHKLNGSTNPVFAELAIHAVWSTCLLATVAAVTLFFAYMSTNKRIVEQPDVSPADQSSFVSRLAAKVVALVIRRPIQRALLLFTFRTITRSRRHRLLLALYSGIGLAIGLVCLDDLLHGTRGQSWNQVNAPLMMASFLILFFVILGTRIVFTFPQGLRCNWIWRVTAVHKPADYFFAVRKSLYVLAAFPVLTVLAAFFFTIWPSHTAVLHMIILILTTIILVERSLYGFRKVPFACSYLPGKTNLKVMILVYAILILFTATQGGLLERWAIDRSGPYLFFSSILSIAAIRSRRRFNEFANTPLTAIQFEDRLPAEVLTIGLTVDQEPAGGETYVECNSEHGSVQAS